MYFWIIAARIRELGNELADDFLITADRALGILMWTGEKFQHEEIRSLAGRPAANYSAAGQASTLFFFFLSRVNFSLFLDVWPATEANAGYFSPAGSCCSEKWAQIWRQFPLSSTWRQWRNVRTAWNFLLVVWHWRYPFSAGPHTFHNNLHCKSHHSLDQWQRQFQPPTRALESRAPTIVQT